VLRTRAGGAGKWDPTAAAGNSWFIGGLVAFFIVLFIAVRKFLGRFAAPTDQTGAAGKRALTSANHSRGPLCVAALGIRNLRERPRISAAPKNFCLCRGDHPGVDSGPVRYRLQRHLAIGHQYGTTIVTFLMVFLIQNTQNRDTEAIQ